MRTLIAGRRRAGWVALAAFGLGAAACGTPASDGSAAAPVTSPGDRTACGSPEATEADLAGAQFAFVGRVLTVADEVHPWTTDPENPDRPAVATTTAWVTFDVEHWYLNDWGQTFSVWMPDISVAPDQRVAVAGNASFTQVAGFAGQSGEVEVCTPAADDSSLAAWDARFGPSFEPSAPTSTTVALPPAKVFGEHDGPCGPTVLDQSSEAADVLAADAACFVAEVDAGRPVVWDVQFPTVEGDPIVTRYEFDGAAVIITMDNSFDNFGSGDVTEQTCTGVVATNWLPSGVDCTTTAGVGFLEDSL